MSSVNLFLSILPFHEPLYIFTILIGLILLSPFIFKLLKLPDVASFIIAGIIIGPYGLNILARDSSIELLGTVGLLYIMFVAGLELDAEKLKVNKRHSIIFGILTFSFPFAIGMIVSRYILQLEYNASFLISIMFSTHTLVAYPIARKLGIHKDISVLTAIGGTIITDTLVLMTLSVITHPASDKSMAFQIAKILTLFGFYLFVIFYTYPKIAHWFFKNVKRDRPVHFLFLLFMVSVSSVLAKLIGVEPIIGAFVAGLALNKSIPKNSLLMQHVDFVGNILFIPIFLIGIGMLINTKIIFSGTYLIFVSSILILSAFAGKWLAAYFSQKLLKFNPIQRNLLFGLSSSHAAATIAVILIGFEKQIIEVSIFNATILIILMSSLMASLITEKYGKKLILTKEHAIDDKILGNILVPISEPSNMANLIAVANSFQTNQSFDQVFVLNIVHDDASTKENLLRIRETLEKNVFEFNNLIENLKVITRVDLNVSSGILRVAKEYMVSDIVIGWSKKATTSQRLFGNIFDHLSNSMQTLYACNLHCQLKNIKKIVVQIPEVLEQELSYELIFKRIINLPIKEEGKVEFQTNNPIWENKIKTILPKKNKQYVSIQLTGNELSNENYEETLLVFFMFKTFLYNSRHNSITQKAILTNLENNFMIIVPGYK